MAYFDRPPRGYSRATAQRRGRARARGRRSFRKGYDRTGGFYGRYAGPRAEHKFFDTSVGAAVTTAMLRNNLCVVIQGNGESNRIGRKMTVRKIHVRGAVVINSGVDMTQSSDQVDCMIVQDMQTNGAIFAATDLIDTDAFTSFRNLANSKRFKVLWKKSYSLSCPAAAGTTAPAVVTGEQTRIIKCNVTCNVPIEYDNSFADGRITTVRSNNLYWCTQSSNGQCTTTLNARIRFSDA